MQLNRTHLDYFEQAFLILYIEVFIFFAFVPKREGLYATAEALAWIALKETFTINAGGTAQEAQRSPHDGRQDERRYGGVVLSQFALGDMTGFRDHSIGVSNRDAVQ